MSDSSWYLIGEVIGALLFGMLWPSQPGTCSGR
jgi:hypothetical protein